MKIYNKILGLLFLASISVGCNKSSIPEDLEEEITIELDKRYIQFNSGISTRAALVEDLYLDADFAALGYQYRGDWGTAKLMARPNVFYQDIENTKLALPQIVTFNEDDGIYTYDPIQAWTGNMYSFFGYYPAEHSSIKLFDDGSEKEGVPYITYTHPTDGDPTKLVDIMTASFIDTSIDFDSEVSMEMEHRLAAMDIRARNQYVYEEKVDEVTSINHLVTIEITKLVFKPEVYTKAKIYLDGSATEGSASNNLTYTIVSNVSTPEWAHSTFDVQPNTSEDIALRDITTSDGDNPTTVLLIPQNTAIGGTLELSYKMKYLNDLNGNGKKDDGEEYIYLENGNEVTAPTTQIKDFNRILEEGYRYYIEITFTSDAVSVNIAAADAWEELDKDVKLEFE